MRELFDICKNEFELLKPVFEETGQADLSDVGMVTIEEYLQIKYPYSDDMPFLTPLKRWWTSQTLSKMVVAYTFFEDPMTQPSLNTIVVAERSLNDFIQKYEASHAYFVAHELAHALHLESWPYYFTTLDKELKDRLGDRVREIDNSGDSSMDKVKDYIRLFKTQLSSNKTLQFIKEGFAHYYVLDYLAKRGAFHDDLTDYCGRLRTAFEESHRTRKRHSMVHKAWMKISIPGYMFFREVVRLAGDEDIIFNIIESTPPSLEEFENPKLYYKQLSSRPQE